MSSKTAKIARFDVRLPQEQKDYFETAVSLGGFRSLTDFLISAAQEKARMIVEERTAILASKKDREIFFSAILNPPQPGERLKAAAKRYKQASSRK